MQTFETEITIESSRDAVWEALSDIGAISTWNPGVKASHVTTDVSGGVGAGRHCDLGGKNYLDEKVVEWHPGERLTMRVIGTNLPLKHADIRFHLRTDGTQTIVSVSPEYELKFAVLGTMMDAVFVRRSYVKGMNALLAGLKQHVESAS